MKDVYKMTVRFDLTDARERNLAEFMQTLDVKKYQSRNQFIIDALADYVDLQSITREQHEEEIRNIIREEMRACFAEANFAPQTVNWTVNDETLATVDQYGKVVISPDAVAANTIEVTATSTFDSTKSDSCTITIA